MSTNSVPAVATHHVNATYTCKVLGVAPLDVPMAGREVA